MPPFEKGNKFGLGRAKGSRNLSTQLLDELASDGLDKLVGKVKQCANDGDMRAASLMFGRVWPKRNGRLISLDLPPVDTAEGLVKAIAEVVACCARGEITAEEAAAISALLEGQRRAIETHDHARRLEALEDAHRRKGAPASGEELVEKYFGTGKSE